MDFKFSKGSETQDQVDGAPAKKNQSALLVLLLILVGGFSYIYFFTGLIKPQSEPAPAAPAAPQTVKKPLPPRDGSVAAPKKEADAPKTAATPAPAVPAPPAKAAPAAPPAAKPAPAAVAAKPAAPAAKPAPAPQVAKAPEKKPAPATAKPAEQKKGDVKVAAVDPKAKVAVAKAADKKAEDQKKAVSEPKVKKSAAPKRSNDQELAVKETGAGKWTVQVGSYVLEEALATDLVRVRKAGLEASVVAGGRKKTSMTRLQVAEFGDRAAAQAELEKLKKKTSDGFVIDNGGKFVVYAGSYLLDSRAASEKERLTSAGYHLTLKRVDIAIPAKLLNAGSFADKKSAEAALNKLKGAGLNAVLKQP